MSCSLLVNYLHLHVAEVFSFLDNDSLRLHRILIYGCLNNIMPFLENMYSLIRSLYLYCNFSSTGKCHQHTLLFNIWWSYVYANAFFLYPKSVVLEFSAKSSMGCQIEEPQNLTMATKVALGAVGVEQYLPVNVLSIIFELTTGKLSYYKCYMVSYLAVSLTT